MRKKLAKKQIEGLLYIAPALSLYTVFVLIPILCVFVYSTMKWDGMGPMTFIGLENFRNIFTSSEFWTAISNNLKFLLLGVPLWTIFPLIVAVLLHEEVKGWKFFKSAYFFPTVISTAVLSTLFKTFFSYNGPVNSIMAVFGLEPFEWFAHGNIAIGLITIAVNWMGFGSAVLIFLAGMANFSSEVFEAADLDGASWWRRLFSITMPLLKPTLQFVVMLNIMSVFCGLFGFVFMITGGGPGYETTVLEYLLYLKAFRLHDMGYASALSVVLFAIVIGITILQRKLTTTKGEKGESIW